MAKKSETLRLAEAIESMGSTKRELTLTGQPYWMGLTDIFPLCGPNDITRLFYQGKNRLIEWVGVRRATAHRYERTFISYDMPQGFTTGDITNGLPISLCEPGAGFEWGTCDQIISGFGRIVASGPVRADGGNDLRLCETSPRYTVGDELITDEDDWDMSNLLSSIMTYMSINTIVGNKATTFQHDGLERIIKTGYTNSNGSVCPLMDSTIINWGGGPMCGGTQGDADADPDPIPSDFDASTPVVSNSGGAPLVLSEAVNKNFLNLYYVLRSVFYRNIERLDHTDLPRLREGDVAIFMPRHAIQCLVDCAVCWLECGGDFVRMDSQTAIDRRREFMNDGNPYITFDGFRVPLVAFNPFGKTGDTGDVVTGIMDNADGTVDILMLYKSVGNRRVLTLEYNPLDDADNPDSVPNENGQFLANQSYRLFCKQNTLTTTWRWVSDAPWLQVRIENVLCSNQVFNLDVAPRPTYLATNPVTNFYTNK